MGFKEKMMNKRMGKMSAEERKEMMESFFSRMSGEEKEAMMKGMMDKFCSGMMSEGKPGWMRNEMHGMMGRMMGRMMSADKSAEGAQGTPGDMCRRMMSGINRSGELATSATPELRRLFEDWIVQIEDEVLNHVKGADAVDAGKIADHFKLSKESVIYILTGLAEKGKINFKKENG